MGGAGPAPAYNPVLRIRLPGPGDALPAVCRAQEVDPPAARRWPGLGAPGTPPRLEGGRPQCPWSGALRSLISAPGRATRAKGLDARQGGGVPGCADDAGRADGAGGSGGAGARGCGGAGHSGRLRSLSASGPRLAGDSGATTRRAAYSRRNDGRATCATGSSAARVSSPCTGLKGTRTHAPWRCAAGFPWMPHSQRSQRRSGRRREGRKISRSRLISS